MNRRHFVQAFASMAMTGLAQSQRPVLPNDSLRSIMFPVWNYGAKGDGVTKDTASIQSAIDACASAGGGTVVLGLGRTYLCGTLVLRSNVDFHLSAGCTLLTSPDRRDFYAMGSLLFAKNETDVTISGTGLIDGNFKAFFPPKQAGVYSVPQPFLGPYDPLYPASRRNPPDGRPRMILALGCKRMKLQDFAIRDSPTWTVHPVGCEDLHISGISIQNDLDVPNCDGIDIDHCRQVRIEGCNIVAGDDCLVLKASRNFGDYGPCEGISITNCTLESSSAGIKVETEGAYPLRSAIISNCSIVRSNRGISFLNRDGAIVEDMLFTGMTIETRMRPAMWWGSGEPIALSSAPRVLGGPAGEVRNVQFSDMECRGESGIYLRGTDRAPLKNITLRGIDLYIEKTTPITGGFYDMRPGYMFGDTGLDRRNTAGVFAANVSGLMLDDIRIMWGPNAPSYYGAGLELHNCREVSCTSVLGEAAHKGAPAALFDHVQWSQRIAER